MPFLPPPPVRSDMNNPDKGSNGNAISQVWSKWYALLQQQVNLNSTSFAPSSAQYVVTAPNSDLTGAQALNVLPSGFLKVQEGTGVLSSTGNILIQSSDLSSTGVAAGTYGSTTQVPVYTVGADGRLQSSTQVTISGTSPGGTAGGDLSGTYPDPTVAKINGASLGTTTATSKNILIADGTNWVSRAASGDLTISANTGTFTLATVNSNVGTFGDGTHVSQVTVNAKGLVTAASSVAITGAAPTGAAGGDLSGTYPNPTVAKINGATLGTTTATSGNLLVANGTSWGTTAPAALTKTDDTNVTLTLGGSPTTALVNAASLTLGWTGQLGLTRGGTNNSITADNGAIVYSDASKLALLASTSTASKILLSGASAAPTWSTSTIPSSAGATANKVLLSDGTNYVLSTPTFPNASATSGKFIRSDGTNWIASTPTLPTTAGTAGKILASDGTNWVSSTPTFPYSASATSRKIIVSDGTNWVASTETYAVPGTSGNVMVSDGTNWTSASSVTTATNATNTAITDDLTTNATMYPTWVTSNTGNLPQKVTSSKLSFNPSTGRLDATGFAGDISNCTGLPEGGLSLTDITTNNSSTSKHGFCPKLDNNSAHFLNGQGAWTTPSGSSFVVQQVRTETGAAATGTTTVPFDDTIPQNTEGNEYMTLAITPTSSSNILVIDVIGNFSPSVANFLIMSLFQDSTANALATVFEYQSTNTGANVLVLRHKMTAGTTSSTTFKMRCGQNAAGTTTFNGQAGGRLFGGVIASSITITEYTS